MCLFPGPLLWYTTWSYWWMQFSSVLMRRIQWLQTQSGFFWLCIFWRFCWSCMCLSPECSSPNTVFGTGENMLWEQVYNIIMSLLVLLTLCHYSPKILNPQYWFIYRQLMVHFNRCSCGIRDTQHHLFMGAIKLFQWGRWFKKKKKNPLCRPKPTV